VKELASSVDHAIQAQEVAGVTVVLVEWGFVALCHLLRRANFHLCLFGEDFRRERCCRGYCDSLVYGGEGL
jgi:hypothetical protein